MIADSKSDTTPSDFVARQYEHPLTGFALDMVFTYQHTVWATVVDDLQYEPADTP